jgi:hypothetical protein
MKRLHAQTAVNITGQATAELDGLRLPDVARAFLVRPALFCGLVKNFRLSIQ